MDLMELFFTSLGAAVVVYYGVKLLLFSKMLYPKKWFPLPKCFFTFMGEWAVVTGASEGIGRAYAFALAEQGMNVVIMSRTKVTLDQVAKDIRDATGQTVKVVVTDFTKENVFSEVEDQLKDLNIGVLVNNVGMLPSFIPCKFLESTELDQTITRMINCNVKTIVRAVAPFGVSTRMAGFQPTNMLTLSPEDFVKSSLQYLRAGDKIHGSICHTVLGWLLQCIPLKILCADSMQNGLHDYVKNKLQSKYTPPHEVQVLKVQHINNLE
ncbi:testosterone 17-beta-dehydrogenase 3 isoform X2 [Thunnus albacares]|uniref:testosterone 17-beta-dehydrogenase 3 isoform X2 n=1 Tax=Thunnus albacares TaxID=8236 RepID=UPI001CF6A89B|nr:testosterone 17-beta-dehydrogenase 3 isoform X2 [Thunnus albacares]